MWLILCNPDDVSALWAGRGLQIRGLTPVEFVSPVEITCSRHIEYRAGDGEPAHALAELNRGTVLDTRQLRGTLNRAARLEHHQLRRAASSDRNYVQAEIDAVMLAWLGALPAPVYNPPHSSGWAGIHLHPFEWAIRAQQAGFMTEPHRCGRSGLEIPAARSANCTFHIVFDGKVFPGVPDAISSAALRLAASAAIPLLGISLQWTADGQVIFGGATPVPDLRVGGKAFLDALAAAMTRT